MPSALNNETFDAALKEHETVLVDFHADWCGPCKILSPTIDELEREHSDKAFFAKVDVDEAPGIAQRFGVMGVPTVVVIRKGREAARFVGVQPKERLADALAAE